MNDIDIVLDVQSTEIEATLTGMPGPSGPQGPAGIGVPIGGTTGQYLKKASSTDYDTIWSAISISDVTSLQSNLDNKQPLDSTLTALAAYSTNGLLTQTAPDTFTGRTITGTTNQITVSNGNGVSGNPTLSLPQDIATGSSVQFSAITLSGLTASTVIYANASKALTSSAVTPTELGYLSGVTSAIQTQIDSKQTSDSTLTSLAAYNTNGLLTQTAADTFTGRTITAGSSKISITNGNGVSGNPTVDVSESSLSLNNIGGTLSISKGGTGQTSASAAFDALSPMTTAGDIVYGGTSGTGTRLAAGTNTQVLIGGTTPSWGAITLTSMVTGVLPIANGGTGSSTQNFVDLTNAQNVGGVKTFSAAPVLSAGASISDGQDIVLGTTNGTRFGTSTSQKIGFFGTTAVVQQAAATDLGTTLSNLGLRASGATYGISTTGTVAASGAFRSAPTTRTGNVTLTTTSPFTELGDATSGAITITLPAANSSNGQFFFIKKIDSSANSVTVSRAGSDTIDGATSFTLATQYKYVILQNDNVSKWNVWGSN